MSSTDAWRIVGARPMATGIYYQLNLTGKGNRGAVTVKERVNDGGPAWVCLTCNVNNCTHTRFVASLEDRTPQLIPGDTDA